MTHFLVSSDWHIRDDLPRCRNQSKSEWVEWQMSRVAEIAGHARRLDGPLVLVGDIFDGPHVSKGLCNRVCDLLKGIHIVAMPGNHDMKDGNDDMTDTTYGVFMRQTGADEHPALSVLPYGKFDEKDIVTGYLLPQVLMLHRLTFEDPSGFPPGVAKAVSAKQLLQDYDSDLILVGDNHTPFVYGGKRKVLNCGSITTQTVTENRPKYIWEVREDAGWVIDQIKLEDDPCEIVADSYAVAKAERTARFDSFLELVKGSERHGLSYKDALLETMDKSEIDPAVRGVLESVLEVVYG